MTTFDIYDEVNRLSDIEDAEKLTEKEVADLFTYFNDTEKLPSVEKALNKSKNDKIKLTFLRNLLTAEQPVAVLKGTADSVYLFIDNSNAYIQGKKETARREAVDEHLVQIDYGKLVETAQDSRHMGAVPVVVGSIPPPEDTIWAKLRNLGYSVTVFERNFLNREKEVDSEVSLRISDTIHEYMPGTVILIAGDGDYGPIFRRVLDKNWRIEIWFWTDGLSSRLTEMNIDYPEYETAIATRTTIINLDDFYKSFMYACGYNGISGTRWLQIFTDLGEDSDIMECYVELDLFGWWYRPKRDSLKLYVRNYSQWEQLKNLIRAKYPNARELNNEVFFLESNTFFKMYYHLKRKVNSVCPKYSD